MAAEQSAGWNATISSYAETLRRDSAKFLQEEEGAILKIQTKAGFMRPVTILEV